MTSPTHDQPTHPAAAGDVACPACHPHDPTDCSCGTCGRTGQLDSLTARRWIVAHPSCGYDAARWAPETARATHTFHFDFTAPSHEAALEIGAALAAGVAELLEQLTPVIDLPGRPVPVTWDVSGTDGGGTDWSVVLPRPGSPAGEHCR